MVALSWRDSANRELCVSCNLILYCMVLCLCSRRAPGTNTCSRDVRTAEMLFAISAVNIMFQMSSLCFLMETRNERNEDLYV